MGRWRVEDNCFTIAHETKDQQQMVCKKYLEIKKRNRRQKENNYIGFMFRIKQGF
jgi:hypothetical protein